MNNEQKDSVNKIPVHKTLRNIMKKVTLTPELDTEEQYENQIDYHIKPHNISTLHIH